MLPSLVLQQLAVVCPPVVCADVFSHECATLSSMSLHQASLRAYLCVRTQCFVSAKFVPVYSRLTPGMCVRAHTPTHTEHIVMRMALWSLHLLHFFYTPSSPAFNLPFLPCFTRSLTTRRWPHSAVPSITPLSSWMQIQECDKSVWFLSCHFAVVTESKTLNTALTKAGL